MKRKFNYVHLKVKFLRPIVAEKTPRYNGDTQQRKEWPPMVCQLTPAQEARMYEILRGIADDPHALEMQQFIQHGTVTTYEHCLQIGRAHV